MRAYENTATQTITSHLSPTILDRMQSIDEANDAGDTATAGLLPRSAPPASE